jgi:hypothetical protein
VVAQLMPIPFYLRRRDYMIATGIRVCVLHDLGCAAATRISAGSPPRGAQGLCRGPGLRAGRDSLKPARCSGFRLAA